MTRIPSKRRSVARLWPVALFLTLMAVGAVALDRWGGRDPSAIDPMPAKAPDGAMTRHPRLINLAPVEGVDAERIYRDIRGDLRSTYAKSEDPIAEAYGTWRRYNRYPYRSTSHGELLVNIYANPVARSYGRFESAGPLPQGALIAKDSFSISRAGFVLVGALFLMEKMAPGFDPETGDWRYILIDSHGNRVGMTGGPDAERVRFCNECHAKARAGGDRLYFVPRDFRLGGADD